MKFLKETVLNQKKINHGDTEARRREESLEPPMNPGAPGMNADELVIREL